MGKVITGFAMSLDGFIALPDGNPGPLFDWYSGGDTAIAYPGGRVTIRVSAASAGVIREMVETTGALVVGRRHFDEANGWGGRHPIDRPVFVVSHRPPPDWLAADAPFIFVAGGSRPRSRGRGPSRAIGISASVARMWRSRRSGPG